MQPPRAYRHRLLLFVLLFFSHTHALSASFQPLLAMRWDESIDPNGWWMSEKFDGIRGLWDGERMWTRNGKTLTIPDELRHELPPFALDGELWAGRTGFSMTQNTVLDENPGREWKAIEYRIFDAPLEMGTFESRMQRLITWLDKHPAQRLKPVKQQRCRGREHLHEFLHMIEKNGGEGVMLRRANSAYESGRSMTLLKVKSYDDSEAVVVGYRPGKGRLQGMVGSLLLELANGTRFAAGSGLSDEQRRQPPAIGTTITFKHQGWTSHGKPRFPVYWRERQ